MDSFGTLNRFFYMGISLLCVAFIIYCILGFVYRDKAEAHKIISTVMGVCIFGSIMLFMLSFWKLNSIDVVSQENIKSVSCLYKSPVIKADSFSSDVANYALKCRNEYESKFGKNIFFTPKFEYSFVDSGEYIDITFDVKFGQNEDR